MIKQSTCRYSIPSGLPPLPPTKCFSPSRCSLCGILSVRMKEALSKSLILGRLVNASQLKAADAVPPPNSPYRSVRRSRCLQVSSTSHYKKMKGKKKKNRFPKGKKTCRWNPKKSVLIPVYTWFNYCQDGIRGLEFKLILRSCIYPFPLFWNRTVETKISINVN